MKLAILSDTLSPTPTAGGHGLGVAVMFMVHQCVALGHDVTLFASADSRPQDHTYTLIAPPDALPTREHESVLARAALAQHRRTPFDVFVDCGHTHILSALLPNLPVLNVYHDIWQPFQRCAVTVSDAQRVLMTLQDARFRNARLLPNLVQRVNNVYTPAPQSERPYALFLGAVLSYKQPLLALQAAAAYGIHIKVAGLHDTALRSLLSGNENVTLLGAVTGAEKWELLANAQVLLNLGIAESFGLTTVEANLCGTPVVAWHTGGGVDLIKYGFNGVIVPPSRNAVQAVASAIDRASDIDRASCRRQALYHVTPPPTDTLPNPYEQAIDADFDLFAPLNAYRQTLNALLQACANGLWW